jgi:hypothetical protein
MEVVWPFDFQRRFGDETLKCAADMDACPQGKVLKRLRWNIWLKDDGEVKIVGGRTVPVPSRGALCLSFGN